MGKKRKHSKPNLRPSAPHVAATATNPAKPADAAQALYLQRGGDLLDLAIETIVVMIELAKVEMKRVQENADYKPSVSPSVAVRAIGQLRMYRKERDALMNECIEMTCETQAVPETQTPPEPATEAQPGQAQIENDATPPPPLIDRERTTALAG
ncbi:MAG: hypothetical protein ACYTDT_14320 [Planctomycetota bacterium]|jgi:hypothetical protein